MSEAIFASAAAGCGDCVAAFHASGCPSARAGPGRLGRPKASAIAAPPAALHALFAAVSIITRFDLPASRLLLVIFRGAGREEAPPHAPLHVAGDVLVANG